MAIKLHKGTDYDAINIKLANFPFAFEQKCEEFVEQGIAKSMDEAKKMLADCEIELELYYDKGYGLMGVESGAVECMGAEIYSPYTGEEAEVEYTCPECGSHNVRTFFDVDKDIMPNGCAEGYICNECGYESEDEEDFY